MKIFSWGEAPHLGAHHHVKSSTDMQQETLPDKLCFPHATLALTFRFLIQRLKKDHFALDPLREARSVTPGMVFSPPCLLKPRQAL